MRRTLDELAADASNGSEAARAEFGQRIGAVLEMNKAVFLKGKRAEIDAMYEALADDLHRHMWGNGSGAIGRTPDIFKFDHGLEVVPSRAPAVTLAGITAVTTLCALEWLRHRKNEIAAAESSGDYESLADEFLEWLRGVFAYWRQVLGLEAHE